MPPTPLTAILQDFRSYRPGNHLQFLEYVSQRSRDLHLVEYARKERSSLLLYIHILNQIRDFRYRHWCLTREFILKQTKHATATGGSPIVTWLPNQLLTVLDTMIAAYDAYTPSANESTVAAEPLGRTCATLIENARRQRDGLRKEVERWIEIRGAEGAEGAEGQAK
ncbi:MAG: hypothetical protein M1819_000834 [Sarea resinae]|nr:MAG: hypothetical protein M1819_000834 [Sarea resinae]